MKYKIIVLGLALCLLAAACNKESTSTTNDNSNTNSNAQTGDNSSEVQSGTVTIEMTGSGFTPDQITIKSGTTVVFKNNDSKLHWPASNPHPTHTDLPGFDALKDLTPGESYSYTFTKTGTWGYHDHKNPTLDGRILVVE